jgi:hypothetical protein
VKKHRAPQGTVSFRSIKRNPFRKIPHLRKNALKVGTENVRRCENNVMKNRARRDVLHVEPLKPASGEATAHTLAEQMNALEAF